MMFLKLDLRFLCMGSRSMWYLLMVSVQELLLFYIKLMGGVFVSLLLMANIRISFVSWRSRFRLGNLKESTVF